MRIDSAVGLVDRSRFPGAPFGRDFSADNLRTILVRNRFEGAILFQTLGGEDEARWLLEVAGEAPWVAAVVLDEGVTASGGAVRGRRLEAGADLPRRAAEVLARGETCVVRFRPGAAREMGELPPGPVVVEALGWPGFGGEAEFRGWCAEIEILAERPETAIGVSNLIDGAGAGRWDATTYRPWVQFALDRFGEDRLLFGSGWPRCSAGGTWKESLAAFTQALGAQTMETREKILGGNAVRQFGLRAAATLAAAR